MSTQPVPSQSRRDAFVAFAATGITVIGLGFILWFALLAVAAVVYFDRVSKHAHQVGYHAPRLFDSPYSIAIGYGASFFIAAFLVSRLKWRQHPIGAAFVAYIVYLAIYLPTVDWGRSGFADTLILFLPLLTAPLGAFLGERWFVRVRSPLTFD